MRIVFDTVYSESAAGTAGTMHLFRVHDGTITTIRSLSRAEWATYSSALKRARSYHTCDQLLVASEANYTEFVEVYAVLHQAEASNEEAKRRASRVAASLNRRLANYLSSLRLYLDVSEARLKRHYGPKSAEFLAFRDACKQEFEFSFFYRFAYKLRNYAQHLGMPIGNIHISARQNDVGGPIEHTADISFNTRELLADGGDIWGSLRSELQSGPVELPVLHVFGDFTQHLRRIRNAVLEAERPYLERLRDTVDELIDQIPRGPGVRQIGEYVNDEGRLGIEFVRSVSELIGPLTPAVVE